MPNNYSDKTEGYGIPQMSGTGPRGRGNGPGQGRADGTGLKYAGVWEYLKEKADSAAEFYRRLVNKDKPQEPYSNLELTVSKAR